MEETKIDLIIPWVDGNDPKWLKEKSKYDFTDADNSSNSAQRFRDWDLMRYFFRGIEKNMPWINKVFFVTWGHLPDWLDTNCKKLRIVRHTDYIPEKYLPTFNSNVIELNYHRIEELSENFILFNDDLFAVGKSSPEDFFKNGLPCDELVAKTLVNYDPTSYIWHIVLNDMGVINRYFSGGFKMMPNIDKWVNPHYGLKTSAMNFSKMFGSRLSSFYDFHIHSCHKKSVFSKLWELEGDYLDKVCQNRFRSPFDLSHWMMRYWNLASGDFSPVDMNKIGKYCWFDNVDESLKTIKNEIENRSAKILVINDTLNGEDEDGFEICKEGIKESFEKIFPEKSSFEKG